MINPIGRLLVLRKQVGVGTPRGLQSQVLRLMLLIVGILNVTKQLIDRILGWLSRPTPESVSESNSGTFTTGS